MVDFGFVLDSSGNIRKEDYLNEKKFVEEITKRFRISQAGTHAAIITFGGHRARLDIKLNQHADINPFLNDLYSLPHLGSTHLIIHGMEIAEKKLFSTDHGGRKEARKMLIVVTDGHEQQVAGNIGLDMQSQGISFKCHLSETFIRFTCSY